MIAILTVSVMGAVGFFFAFRDHGVFVALMSAGLGGSVLAAITAVWIARRAEKRQASAVKQAPTSAKPVDPIETGL